MEDQARFRRFSGSCPYYRENWVNSGDSEPGGETVLYEIYCLRDQPPVTQKEQDKCMRSRFGCWRLTADARPPARRSAAPESAWPPSTAQPPR